MPRRVRAEPEAPHSLPGRSPATMRLGLHGAPEEMAPAIAALARVLDIRDVSRPYHDRPPSTLHRVYLDATPRGQDQAQTGGCPGGPAHVADVEHAGKCG